MILIERYDQVGNYYENVMTKMGNMGFLAAMALVIAAEGADTACSEC